MSAVVSIVLVNAELTGTELRLAVPAATEAPFSSVSHTRGLSAIAYADVRVGIDLEFVRKRARLERLIERTTLASERGLLDGPLGRDYGFAQHWTRVEAYLKAIGVGIAGGYLTRPGAGWSVVDLDLAGEHVGSLAAEAEAPTVTTRWITSGH